MVRSCSRSTDGTSSSRDPPVPVRHGLRAADRRPDRSGQAGRGRVDEPQGDPQAARQRSRPPAIGRSTGVKKASQGNPESSITKARRSRASRTAKHCLGAPLSGGTAWLYSHGDFDCALDYLFIDEAGQVSLADALAMGTSARNLVLVGDPQQLAQVLQGTHPDGVGGVGAQYLLGEQRRSRPTAGSSSRRPPAPPRICGYISEEFYEGRLRPDPSHRARTTPLGTGLRYVPVDHEGCRQESAREAERVAAESMRLRAGRRLGDEIARRRALQRPGQPAPRLLPGEVRVGTVDKFQGQEAPVVHLLDGELKRRRHSARASSSCSLATA